MFLNLFSQSIPFDWYFSQLTFKVINYMKGLTSSFCYFFIYTSCLFYYFLITILLCVCLNFAVNHFDSPVITLWVYASIFQRYCRFGFRPPHTANITIKWFTQFFLFSGSYRSYVYSILILCAIVLCLKHWCTHL